MALLLDRVRRSVRRDRLWAPGARVAVALSGGADSVALLFLLHDLAAAGELQLAGAAHLHHGLRSGADEDAAFCAALAGRLGVPFEAACVDAAARAWRTRCSVEAAARAARYEFFEAAATRLGADHVAVGHTRDDQAETVLLRLLRGSGSAGLRGILPVRGRIVRPLLGCTRAELRAYLVARGEPWREDETNADPRLPRNRVRLELLPYLRRHFSRGVDAVLARTAEVARVEDALLRALEEQAFARAVTVGTAGVRIEAHVLGALPEALQWRVARRALATAAGGRAYGMGAARAVVQACAGEVQGGADLPGLRMERFRGAVVLSIRRAPGRPVPFAHPLAVPGEVWIPEAGCRLVAQRWPAGPAGGRPDRDRVLVDAEALALPLTVRSRRPGDWLRPVGLGGRKKLQDLFVDRKVARAERDRVPIVADRLGRIVWVAGHALDERFRATGASSAVVGLSLIRPSA